MKGLGWGVVVLALVLTVGAGPAAGATGPPKTKLRTKGDAAVLRAGTYGWSYPSENDLPGTSSCGSVIADGVRDYKPVLRVRHNRAKTSVVFFRNRRPSVNDLRAHSTLNRRGQPKGRGQEVRSHVVPRRRGGRITGWKVVFRADAGRRPYIDLDVGFPIRKVDGCDEGGAALYSFSVRRRAHG